MNVYQIKNTPSETDYNGCGKAWAAIKDGQVIAIRYMSQTAFNNDNLDNWVKAVLKVAPSLSDFDYLKYVSPKKLGDIKKAAISAGHPEFGPRGGDIKASDIARKAQEIVREEESTQFKQYRTECRSELAKLGEVVSGMCSCYEFVANA